MREKKGILFLVGMGPGSHKDMTARCIAVLRNCEVVIGYQKYVDLIRPFIAGKQVISSRMTQEVVRCRSAIELAKKGKTVALVSSGDSGVYGMAGLVLEIVERKKLWEQLEIEIIPGVPALHAAAARLGAPLMNDYAVISLSDLLTPWELIVKRLTHAARADFVLCLYNPKSKVRTSQIKEAQRLVLKFRAPDTPVAIGRNIGRRGESLILTTLSRMLCYKIDMVTLIIIGNSSTVVRHKRMITPRGYFSGSG